MDIADLLRRLPEEIRSVGGSPARRIGVAVLALLVNAGFYLPSLPQGTPGAGVPGVDKVYHVLALALLVWALGRLLAPRRRFPVGWVAVVAAVHVVVVELVQAVALPGRTGDVDDAIAGLVGVALAIGLRVHERRRAAAPEPVAAPAPAAEGEHRVRQR